MRSHIQISKKDDSKCLFFWVNISPQSSIIMFEAYLLEFKLFNICSASSVNCLTFNSRALFYYANLDHAMNACLILLETFKSLLESCQLWEFQVSNACLASRAK